eukprot:GHVS01078647.1.p2 GENE.GHVS01078647.1~~GHVS01078647.1.p2  ORF type:complete len:132 (+),score=7.18 GHVS01078647.1:622-1017(+)
MLLDTYKLCVGAIIQTRHTKELVTLVTRPTAGNVQVEKTCSLVVEMNAANPRMNLLEFENKDIGNYKDFGIKIEHKRRGVTFFVTEGIDRMVYWTHDQVGRSETSLRDGQTLSLSVSSPLPSSRVTLKPVL